MVGPRLATPVSQHSEASMIFWRISTTAHHSHKISGGAQARAFSKVCEALFGLGAKTIRKTSCFFTRENH